MNVKRILLVGMGVSRLLGIYIDECIVCFLQLTENEMKIQPADTYLFMVSETHSS
ncbi:hypothetical protein HanRHA438_Chr04g0150281 [Helianthus annuus]|nr:hypothetical protein HanRHA438_Chr04g0150281 [Helianthus annuus]